MAVLLDVDRRNFSANAHHEGSPPASSGSLAYGERSSKLLGQVVCQKMTLSGCSERPMMKKRGKRRLCSRPRPRAGVLSEPWLAVPAAFVGSGLPADVHDAAFHAFGGSWRHMLLVPRRSAPAGAWWLVF